MSANQIVSLAESWGPPLHAGTASALSDLNPQNHQRCSIQKATTYNPASVHDKSQRNSSKGATVWSDNALAKLKVKPLSILVTTEKMY